MNWREFLLTPPGWALAILTTVLVGHLLEKAIVRGKLVETLEFFVIVVVGALAMHSVIGPTVAGKEGGDGMVFGIMLVAFAAVSIILYIIDRRSPSA